MNLQSSIMSAVAVHSCFHPNAQKSLRRAVRSRFAAQWGDDYRMQGSTTSFVIKIINSLEYSHDLVEMDITLRACLDAIEDSLRGIDDSTPGHRGCEFRIVLEVSRHYVQELLNRKLTSHDVAAAAALANFPQ